MTFRPSILDGIDVTVLQQRLQSMQLAYLDITSGAKVEVVSYSQADGSRTVTYSKANIAELTAAIIAVQSQIDRLSGQCVGRRAPMRPYFGSTR
jgi:virulence-associated protein VapD